MAFELIIPKFATEAEEVEWWDAHREELSDEFERAGREGRLRVGTVRKLAMAAEMGLELTPDQAHQVFDEAARLGMTFQQYINLLVHQALEQKTAA